MASHTIGGGIVKGTDRGDRIGDSIQMKGVKLRVRIENTQTSSNMARVALLRLMFVRNREPHDGIINNLFKGEGATIYTPDDYVATGDADQIWKPLNRKKFAVLFDKKIKCLIKDPSSMGKNVKNFNVYVPLRARIKFGPDADAGNYDYIKPNYNIMWFLEFQNSDATTPSGVNCNVKVTEFYRG
jgi:hypothetical protein